VGDRRGDGNGDRPGASTLGALAGVRALADVQRRGLLAAGELVDRLVSSVDGDGDGHSHSAAGGQTPAGSGVGSVDELVQVWLELVRLGVDVIAQAATTQPQRNHGDRGASGATVDVGSQQSSGSVRVEAQAGHSSPSGESEVEVWLHNGTADAQGGIRLHCGDLRAHDGRTLPADAVRFEPPVVDLPGRSSRGVTVHATATDRTTVGTYRGVILAAGAPGVWLPLEVDVTGDPTDR
jgi:hypothetical protein